ncbi:DNA polymerase III subunit delta' [Tolumonas lignilytica]|uniref:DNA polymerase III subunit delta' n=1 Tax=Tolumonas lignilytica TaxID=1283284 RepID=UPI0004655628|nr:DNA polymerase III subunit delta' [Tolumonas lignilytica]
MYPWLMPYWLRFQQVFANKRLPHAFLLVGPDGIGKSALAMQWASLFLCEHPQDNSPCGQCHACQLSRQQVHPDWHVYGADDAKSISVDTIRQLSAQLMNSAQLGRGKVAVILHAERMTEAAENALLKTLEEPPGNSLLILQSESAMKLLPTIVSRCQVWTVQADEQQALTWLQQQLPGRAFSSAVLHLNQGAPLRTLAYLNEGGEQQRQMVIQALDVYRQQPWTISGLTKCWVAAMPATFEWLSRLLLDALKLQQGVVMQQLASADHPELLSYLAQRSSECLLDSMQQLLQLKQSLAEMPSGVPSILFADWLTQLFSKE